MVEININMDGKCSDCGEKGITGSGLCLKCASKRLKEKHSMETKVNVYYIDKFKIGTEVELTKDKDGDIIERKLVTTIRFKSEVPPENLAIIHTLQASDTPVHCVFGSPQAIMDFSNKESAFAEK
jgi:uncharacterized OB-fold protein